MINYSFCFPNNVCNSYSVNMRTDLDVTDLFIPDMVDLTFEKEHAEEVRLKVDEINEVLVAYLRTACKVKFFKLA